MGVEGYLVHEIPRYMMLEARYLLQSRGANRASEFLHPGSEIQFLGPATPVLSM